MNHIDTEDLREHLERAEAHLTETAASMGMCLSELTENGEFDADAKGWLEKIAATLWLVRQARHTAKKLAAVEAEAQDGGVA